MNQLEQLRHSVNILSNVNTVDVAQEQEGKHVIVKARVEPLIGQLRTAIASSVAGGGQGSNLASERNVLNAEALDLYERIDVGAAALLATYSQEVPHLTPEKNLRVMSVGVYQMSLGGSNSESELHTLNNKLTSWIRQIERILTPPVTLELMGACPECLQTHAKVNENESGRALIIEWHTPDHGFVNALHNCVARCRSCRNEWRGDLQLRELSYVLENSEEKVS
jgi:hypothetical protein